MSQRIVSLISSGTEILHALGLGPQLVGRSHECDFPPGIQALPVCSEPRIDIHASSEEIDRQVKSALRSALSIYNVFTAELNRLQPTHILTQSQCEVCAVSLEDVRQAVCQIVGSQPEIVSLEPMDLNQIWADIRRTATALQVASSGEALVERLRSQLDAIGERSRKRAVFPSIVCLEWLKPLMSAGNWVPELVQIAGGVPLLCEAGKHSPYFEWSALLAADPDVIAIMPCGFGIPRATAELPCLLACPEWLELRAVQQGRVYITDGNQYFNRPGPRIIESTEILEEILWDDGSDQRSHLHHSSGWIRLNECRM